MNQSITISLILGVDGQWHLCSLMDLQGIGERAMGVAFGTLVSAAQHELKNARQLIATSADGSSEVLDGFDTGVGIGKVREFDRQRVSQRLEVRP